MNEIMEKALAHAREMQRSMNEAMNKSAEQMKPFLSESLKNARELQSTLSKHATESSAIASQQAQTAIGHLNEFIKMGSDAMRESAEQTRATAEKMMEHSRKAVEAANAAATSAAREGENRP